MNLRRIDIRSCNDEEKRNSFFSEVLLLSPGVTLEWVTNRDPQELIEDLQSNYRISFRVEANSVLPGEWVIRVQRSDEAKKGGCGGGCACSGNKASG